MSLFRSSNSDLRAEAPVTNGFRDSAFTNNKAYPLHRWVPWIAGFSAEFVEDCLTKYLGENSSKHCWILDPFAGVGTTLLQSLVHGHNVVGFEINPYAVLAIRTKLNAAGLSVDALADCIAMFERFMAQRCPDFGTGVGEPDSGPPEGFSGRTQLFSPKVERKVLFVLDFINSIRDSVIRDVFRLAFGAVMISFSNYSYEPSLTRRAAVDRPDIEDAPVARILTGKLRLILEDTKWLHERLKGLRPKPKARLIPESIFSAPRFLKKESFIDLVVTSPPYLNNYHYPRNTRPQIYWLGMASGRGYKGARQDESFGKFWQSVRELPPIELSFHMPELKEITDAVRCANPDKGIYGGSGWANYIATYFNDTLRFCHVLSRLMTPRGKAVIVLGNSIIQGVEVKTDYYFGKIAELCGLQFAETVVLRNKRTGTSIIQSSVRVEKATKKTVLYESAIILSK